MKPTLTEAGTMTCEYCEVQCQKYETYGAIFDNKFYVARCKNCGRFYRSEDELHWEILWQIKPEEAQDEK